MPQRRLAERPTLTRDLVIATAMTIAEVGGFSTSADSSTWQSIVRGRVLAARRVMLRHPWVPAVMESRSMLVPTMGRYIDAQVGAMRAGGLSHDLIHHSMHALGSRLFG